MAFFVHQTSFISVLARLPTSYSIILVIFTTIYIEGVLILSSHGGQSDTKPQQIEKWLNTAQSNCNSAASAKNKPDSEKIRPHSIVGYQMPLAAYFGSSIASVLLSRILHTPIPMPNPQHRPHSHYSQAPALIRFAIGTGGLILMDISKSLVFKRQERLSWPEQKQAVFTFVCYFLYSVWIILGTGLVCAWGWPLEIM